MLKWLVISLGALPVISYAQTPPQFVCEGTNPAWSLRINGDTANFAFVRDSDMTVPQTSITEGQDWPRAYTLISREDTAIAIIDAEACGVDPYSIDVLTQRGQTPILLTGCCRPME